jgi:hypothetical protein
MSTNRITEFYDKDKNIDIKEIKYPNGDVYSGELVIQ